jgi:hypothetical protein
MRNGFQTFEITDTKQKKSFTDIRHWEANFKNLQCAAHRKNARLDLLIDKKGPSVAIRACCGDFFNRIVESREASM